MATIDGYEWDPDYDDANAGDRLPDCFHCGGEGASRRVYLESGARWFHQRCWERFNRLPLRQPEPEGGG